VARDKAKNTGEGDVRQKCGGRKELTDAQKAENDQLSRETLSDFMLHMFWKEPFFYRILQAAHVRFSRTDVPTAGVSVSDARIDFVINPDFLSDLIRKDKNHVIGLIQHEAYHLAYGHCTLRWKPHTVANWAFDLSINTNIPESDLPSGAWIPGRRFDPIPSEDLARMTQEDKDWFKHLDDLVVSFPPKMSALWYYEKLLADEKINDMVQKAQELSDLLKELLSMDDHFEGDEISEGDIQVVNGILAEAVADAIRETTQRGWGSIPSEVQEKLRALISREVDWRSIFRQFTGRCRKSLARTTFKRRSRKCPGLHPGRTRRRTSRVAIFMDQSGSMSNDELSLLVGELNSLSQFTAFDLFPFDTQVVEDKKVEWRKGMTVSNFPRVRCGGTDFQVCVDFIHSRGQRGVYDGYLILTDGGAAKPTTGRVRRGYILTPGNKLYFDPDPTDVVIQMKGKN